MIHPNHRNRLDVVDRVRKSLLQEFGRDPDNQQYLKELLEELPSFVVTGAEKAGKSSTLKKISGIDLPTDTERCTKIAIVLELRREPIESVPEIYLIRLKGDVSRQKYEVENGNISQVILQAQNQALSESESSYFAEYHYIEVKIRSPTVPNVTLTDLPGFTSISAEENNLVQRIVKQHLVRSGVLILHVVKASHHYGSILGNDFLMEFADKCTSVFTHWDEAESIDMEKQKSNIIQAIERTCEPRFAILSGGKVENELEKLNSLQCLHEYRDKFEFGVDALKAFLEQRIDAHFDQQLPKTIQNLQKKMEIEEQTEERVKERDPSSVLFEIVRKIEENWKAFRGKEMLKSFRKLKEALKRDIRNLHIRPVTVPYAERFQRRGLEKDEEIEIGMHVFVPHRKEKLDFELATVVSETSSVLTVKYESDGVLDRWVARDNVKTLEAHTDLIITDIKNIIEDEKEFRMDSFADRQPVLERFAKDFSTRLGTVSQQHLADLKKAVRKFILEKVFHESFVECGKKIESALQIKILFLLEETAQRAQARLQEFIEWNTPPLVFSTNEHYVNQTFRNLIAKDEKNASTDKGALYEIYYHVRAYWKDQNKMMIEMVTKCLLQHFVVCVDREVQSFLRNLDGGSLVQLIHEPPQMKITREVTRKRIKVLTEQISRLEEIC